MVDKYSCLGDRAEQISATFYLNQYKKLHADPFDRRAAAEKALRAPVTHKSTVSEASPNFFRTHKTLQLRPSDYTRKIPLADAFHKETHEFLNPDGTRRHAKLKIGGVEDTAVSRDAPTWFRPAGNSHSSSSSKQKQPAFVTEVPLREKPTMFSPFWQPPGPERQKASAVSEAGPEWMKLRGLPPGFTPSDARPSVWDHSWHKAPGSDLAKDRAAAVSADSPTWFRVDHVPVCRRGGARGTGLLKFGYGGTPPGTADPRQREASAAAAARQRQKGKKKKKARATTAPAGRRSGAGLRGDDGGPNGLGVANRGAARGGAAATAAAAAAAATRGSSASSARRRGGGSRGGGGGGGVRGGGRAAAPLRSAGDFYDAINQLQDKQLDAARARLAQLQRLASP